MSADFWAGYISGAVSIILGNPLDVLKVKLQAGRDSSPTSTPAPAPSNRANPLRQSPNSVLAAQPPHHVPSTAASYIRPFLLGTAAPVLGYGALNALLFVSYNRTEALLNQYLSPPAAGPNPLDSSIDQGRGTNLLTTWLAGAVGGLATWVVSTPTELIKCRAQLQIPSHPLPTLPTSTTTTTTNTTPSPRAPPATTPQKTSSLQIAKTILQTTGIRGLYHGGTVTALRDSIGYGFYFWGYELCSRWMAPAQPATNGEGDPPGSDAARVLLCGGLAGIITWASIFPLDVVKTRLQTQAQFVFDTTVAGSGTAPVSGEREALLGGNSKDQRKRNMGAWDVAKETYREGGIRPFFRGLVVCSVRAFIVNAVQWAVYEWIMMELGQGRRRRDGVEGEVGVGAA